MKSTKKARYIALATALTVIAAAIIIYPERYVKTTFQGFSLWAECVLPSLFPFMVISLIFIKSGLAERASLPLAPVMRAVKLPKVSAACFLMSLCSGYPAGARIISEAKEDGLLSENDCKKLAYICSTTGPLFAIGVVGYKLFGDKSAGTVLFLAHALAVLISGVALSLFSKREKELPSAPLKRGGNALYDSFYSAAVSVCLAGAFISFFVTVAAIVEDLKILYPLQCALTPLFGEGTAKAICTGLVEATAGCRDIAAGKSRLALPLAGACITFGGASIILQQLCYLTKCGVSPVKFIGVKAMQALLCFLLCFLFCGGGQ